jgi:hypothetical protein
VCSHPYQTQSILVHTSGKLDYKFLYKENLFLESFLLMRLSFTVFAHFGQSKVQVPHWWFCLLHALIQENRMTHFLQCIALLPHLDGLGQRTAVFSFQASKVEA